jgi:hypothetical protein
MIYSAFLLRYVGTFFDLPNFGLPLEMLQTPGDSGSALLNAQGQAISLYCFDYGAFEYGDRSGSLLLAPYQSWTESVESANVPEPRSLSLMVMAGISLLIRRRKAV